jgi:hypothetical protein
MPHFWLTYRHPDGGTAGVVVIESVGLLHARLKASLAGADRGLEFVSGHPLDPVSAKQIPANMIGRFLDDGDLRKLQRGSATIGRASNFRTSREACTGARMSAGVKSMTLPSRSRGAVFGGRG